MDATGAILRVPEIHHPQERATASIIDTSFAGGILEGPKLPTWNSSKIAAIL